MIGIDTNILVRILVQDDPNQTQLALKYIHTHCKIEKVVINPIVLCELISVLESNNYSYSKHEIINVIEHVLIAKQFYILYKDSVRLALSLYKNSSLDFSDALSGYLNYEKGCSINITFDKKAAKTPLYKLLE